MRVAITGASGYIGSALAAWLEAGGVEVDLEHPAPGAVGAQRRAEAVVQCALEDGVAVHVHFEMVGAVAAAALRAQREIGDADAQRADGHGSGDIDMALGVGNSGKIKRQVGHV